MARENYNAAYIGSEDTWGFDNDTFNDETNFYADVWVIDSSEDADDTQQLSPCSLYYEVAKTDDHLFTPTEIIYDDGAGVLLIVGEQGRIGEPDVTAEQRRFYSIGQKARRYKHMTDGQGSREAGRFKVDKIVVSNDPQKKEIVEYLEKIEEELTAGAESFGAESAVCPCGCAMKGCVCSSSCEGQCLGAESFDSETDNQDFMEVWDADNIDRINPVFVEGAEDVHGAEGIEDSLVGQNDDGLVIGQSAEGCLNCGSSLILNAEGGSGCGCGTNDIMDAESFESDYVVTNRGNYRVRVHKKNLDKHGKDTMSKIHSEANQKGLMYDEETANWITLNAESFDAEKRKCILCKKSKEIVGDGGFETLEGKKMKGAVCSTCEDEFVNVAYEDYDLPNTQYVRGAESFGAEGFSIDSAFIHYGAEGDETSRVVEVHSEDGGIFLAELETGLILHNDSSFAAEDDTPLSAEELDTILAIAAETEGTPSYSFGADYDEVSYDPITSHNPTATNPITEPHEAEDIIEFIQEVSPFQMNGWVASTVVIGSALLFGRMVK